MSDQQATDLLGDLPGKLPRLSEQFQRHGMHGGADHFRHDGNPLPSFEGEPKRIGIPDDMNAFADTLWSSLNEDNKVSLWVYYKDLRVERKGYQVKAIETTGAGDTFCGCAIHGLLKYGLEGLTEESLGEILSYANAGAALITMKKGAIRSMPEPSEIEALQA